jgi:hypothetical protein
MKMKIKIHKENLLLLELIVFKLFWHENWEFHAKLDYWKHHQSCAHKRAERKIKSHHCCMPVRHQHWRRNYCCFYYCSSTGRWRIHKSYF